MALLAASGPSLDRLQIDPTPRPARPVSQVRVPLGEPTQPYRSIALVEASTAGSADLSRLGNRLKEEAARLGGDAVLVSGWAGKSGLLGRVIVFTR